MSRLTEMFNEWLLGCGELSRTLGQQVDSFGVAEE
jgi:hypothetical protein